MLLDGKDVAKILGSNIKKARLKRGYTQEFLADKVNISIDLLRNIENSRNVGSVTTLLNLCNFLEITPNAMFENLYTTKEDTLDTTLQEYFGTLSTRSKKALQKIIIHLDKNY